MSDKRSAQYLYRMYDANDALLYVGISTSAIRRMAEHKETQPWFHEVARVEIERHECDRSWIAAEEKRVIRSEMPRHNKLHNAGGPAAHATPRFGRSFLNVGDVYAFGLRDGTCPVGAVVATSRDEAIVPIDHVVIDLFSFLSGYFGHAQALIDITTIERLLRADVMSEQEERWSGCWDPDAPRIWDMDPLGAFQTDWTSRYAAPNTPA